jgi:hypothetical protein
MGKKVKPQPVCKCRHAEDRHRLGPCAMTKKDGSECECKEFKPLPKQKLDMSRS